MADRVMAGGAVWQRLVRGARRSGVGLALYAGLALAAVLPPGAAAAEAWTATKPIRLVLPYAPGGTTDLIGRIIAQPLARELSTEVIVDNRGGGGGVIGMSAVAHAAPDGYTIALPAIGAHAANETLLSKLPYDSQKDFTPIILLGQSPLVLVVSPGNPAQSVQQLIAQAREKGKPLNFASGGIGLGSHIAGELLKLQSRADMTHIAYKGGGPAMADVMAGQVDLLFAPVGSVLPFVKGGKLKALAIASQDRSPNLPDVPTMAQSGFPDFIMGESWGLWGPGSLPPEIVARLHDAVAVVLRQPEVIKRFDEQGVEVTASTPAGLREYLVRETKKFRDVIVRARIKVE